MTMTRPDISELVQQHQAGVWWYLRFLGADEATADDLTQDTFIAFMQAAPELDDPAATGGYLRTMARHALWRAHRLRRLPGMPASQADMEVLATAWERVHPPVHEPQDGDGMLAALADCVERLPEQSRQLVRLKYEQESSSAEMAGATGLREGTVRVVLHRALRLLHECVTQKMK